MISRRVRGPGGIVRWVPLAPAPGRPRTAQHGTDSGYARHLRDKEPACVPCLEAHRTYGREAYRRRRDARAASQEAS